MNEDNIFKTYATESSLSVKKEKWIMQNRSDKKYLTDHTV